MGPKVVADAVKLDYNFVTTESTYEDKSINKTRSGFVSIDFSIKKAAFGAAIWFFPVIMQQVDQFLQLIQGLGV
jgi:hypothetical protein